MMPRSHKLQALVCTYNRHEKAKLMPNELIFHNSSIQKNHRVYIFK